MLVCMVILNREHSTLQLPKNLIYKAEFSIVWVVEYFSVCQKHQSVFILNFIHAVAVSASVNISLAAFSSP